MYEVVLVMSTWLIGACTVITIIYWVTSGAIESSKLAREVQELKQMVQQLLNDQKNPVNATIDYDGYCSACSSKLSSSDLGCPACMSYKKNNKHMEGIE